MELILASGEGYRLCEPQVRLEKSSWKRGDQEATFDPTFIDPWYGYDRGRVTQDTLSLKLKIRYIIIRVLLRATNLFKRPPMILGGSSGDSRARTMQVYLAAVLSSLRLSFRFPAERG